MQSHVFDEDLQPWQLHLSLNHHIIKPEKVLDLNYNFPTTQKPKQLIKNLLVKEFVDRFYVILLLGCNSKRDKGRIQ